MNLTIAGCSSNFHSKSRETRWNLLLNPTFSVVGKITECHYSVAPCLVLGCTGWGYRLLKKYQADPENYKPEARGAW